ncbi:peptidase M24 [Haloprofundus marisrubri]|uniref:Peptidase M24 n=1 Tax=Haloprofundus marisrubri TaxID=1514971 RepID=A0A0W1R9Y8_9EURY|nr:Xaa-Pro peptidase family protein [Haloprofundus marisrubri]KTG10150.1 peptidase M24 [Haloprofundus marisrubri]
MQALTPAPESQFVDDDRLERIRTALKAHDADGFLAFAPQNSYYLTGTYAGMYSRAVVGLVTEETSVFVGPYIERRKAQRTAWTDEVRVYEDTDDPYAVVAEAIDRTEATTLGIDRGVARPEWVDGVDSQTEATLVDATEQLRTLRITKTPWEVSMMRRASDLAAAEMEAYLDGTRSGRPELDVLREMQSAAYDTYLDRYPEYDIGTANELGQYGFASVLAGDHALESHSISSAREIRDGDSVVGIALPSVQGYICEEERTILVGDVDDDITEAMETLIEVRNGTMERLGPGEPTDEIDAWTAGQLRDAGYASNLVHRTGHGEGVTIHEAPAMNERVPGELRPGMVISVEPGIYFPDRGIGLRHSDTFVVTEDGAERLTHSEDGVIRRA